MEQDRCMVAEDRGREDRGRADRVVEDRVSEDRVTDGDKLDIGQDGTGAYTVTGRTP
jgi:hypothetical protein